MMAKPDDRSDNVDHLQEHVQNTIDNLEQSENYLAEHSEEISSGEQQQIQQNIDNRKKSIAGMRDEISDEANHHELMD